MDMRQLLDTDDVLFDVGETSKEGVIACIVARLAERGCLEDAGACVADVLAREREVSTGLICGVAIPHAKSAHVRSCRVGVARLREPITWETLDGTPVSTVILIVAPEGGCDEHLRVLAALAEKLMDQDACARLGAASDGPAVLSILGGDAR